ncbi:MAG: hypothetical protein HFH94_10385 [Lachnospiraceae bacterium]|nr:hypothetical protein [uncultured Acetatifactor sp.]MCI9220127.1 hypothetical protein [Lachnospiraceae bacterium]
MGIERIMERLSSEKVEDGLFAISSCHRQAELKEKFNGNMDESGVR